MGEFEVFIEVGMREFPDPEKRRPFRFNEPLGVGMLSVKPPIATGIIQIHILKWRAT